MFFFFFSSRRRHTRCLSDWSSDVCSSDLFREPLGHPPPGPVAHLPPAGLQDLLRSEERRGGKERRSRWSPDYLKKKNVSLNALAMGLASKNSDRRPPRKVTVVSGECVALV